MTTPLFDRATCLVLSFSRPGTTRALRASEYATGANDKSRTSASKRLMQSPQLKAIIDLDASFKQAIEALSVPAPMFRGGVYLVPNDNVGGAEVLISASLDTRGQLVANFVAAYDGIVEADRQALGPLFKPANYPPKADIAREFAVNVQWFTFSSPGNLVKRETFERQVREAVGEVVQGLRYAFGELVAHLVERLTGEREGGKPKIFRDSAVTKLQEFVAGFGALNITGDAALESLVDQARQLVDGVSPDRLRDDTATRERVARELARVQETLAPMLEDQPERRVMLDEGEPDADSVAQPA